MWWQEFSRPAVLAAIEESSGSALAASDPLPDTLIATAEALGLTPLDLKLFIYDRPHPWTIDALTTWAHRYGLVRSADTGNSA